MEDTNGSYVQDGKHELEERSLASLVQEEYELTNKLMDRHGHTVDVFREEYQHLFDAAMASATSISLAKTRKDQLTAELLGHREKIGNLETYQEDAKSSRINLLATVENMKQQLAELTSREAQKLEAASKLRSDIEAGSTKLAAGPGWTVEQEDERKRLLVEAAELQREVELKQRDHLSLRGEVSKLSLHVEQRQQWEQSARERVEGLEARAASLQQEARAEARRKDNLEELLVSTQARAKQDQEVYRNQKACLKTETEHILVVEEQLRASKEEMERCLAHYDDLFQTIQKLSDELKVQATANTSVQEENARKKQATEAARVKLRGIEKATVKAAKLRDLAQTKIEDADAERRSHEERRDVLKAKIYALDSVEMKAGRKRAEALHRQIGELKREKDILERKYVSSDRAASVLFSLTKANEGTLKGLSDDRQAMKHRIRTMRQTIEQLAGERQQAEKDALEHTCRWKQRMEQLKQQGQHAVDLQTRISAATARLKQQQKLYEAVRNDRNGHSKDLIETQEVMKDMKQRFKIMNHQIEQLKDEITVMDHSLVKEHFHHHSVDKDAESLRNEVTKVKKQIVSGEHIALHQRSELEKLSRIIQEAEEERQRQVKEHDAIVGEKCVLFAQLMKRNDELGVLYERIRVQTSSLHQGEVRYQQSLSTIRDLEGQIKTLEATLLQSRSQAENSAELKAKSHKLEKGLTRECMKIRALEEELAIPLNVHRWRKLESSDPGCYDLVRKAQSLQRALITKTETIVKKELLIQEKEKLYMELKKILGRQPGSEVAEQLEVYQDNLKQKVKQMKAMETELGMYKQQVDLFKSEIRATGEAMRSVRQRWVEEQRRARKQDRLSGDSCTSVWGPGPLTSVAMDELPNQETPG